MPKAKKYKAPYRIFQTTREQAHPVGDNESHGRREADSVATVPFERRPNVWLKAGSANATLESLIAGIDDGVLIDGATDFPLPSISDAV